MRLSDKKLSQLKQILKDENQLDYTDEELQMIGLAIVRFIIAKHMLSEADTEGSHD